MTGEAVPFFLRRSIGRRPHFMLGVCITCFSLYFFACLSFFLCYCGNPSVFMNFFFYLAGMAVV